MPVQELIHKYEVGAGNRVLKIMLGFIAMIALAIFYDLSSFRNISTPEGMDAAQLARNLADGKGYTTEFIRPFSIFLLNRRIEEKAQNAAGDKAIAPASSAVAETNSIGAGQAAGGTPKPLPTELAQRHPDLANPPLYPALLAGMLKIMPFDYPDLLAAKSFFVYMPDLWIAVLNQALLLLAACLVFRLARRCFDEPVAWVSAAVFLGTEMFWRFSVSGLSTPLLIVLFLALADVLALLDRDARQTENPPSQGRLLCLAAVAGLLTGLAGLTRYSFALLAIPLVLWMAFLPARKQALLTLTAVGTFLLVMTPWVLRNYELSGTPFGTTGYAMVQMTTQFPEDHLDRSLHPDFRQMYMSEYWQKFWANSQEMIQKDLPRFGGSWVAALFLVGLLVSFRNPTLGRLRLFLVMCLGLLFCAQALGRTGWTADSPEISSDNLLAVLAPLAFIFGVGFLFTLLESAVPAMRSIILAAVFGLAWAPMILNFISPPGMVYFPPWIQEKANRVEEGGVMMSDVPWAVAWYGHRQSLWLALEHRSKDRVKEDFYAASEQFRPISGLYLTSKTLKTMEIRSVAQWVQEETEERPDKDWERFVGLATSFAEKFKEPPNNEELQQFRRMLQLVEKHWIRGDDESWASFLLGIYVNREVPTGFPLRRAPLGLVPEIFLTDSERKAEKAIQSSK